MPLVVPSWWSGSSLVDKLLSGPLYILPSSIAGVCSRVLLPRASTASQYAPTAVYCIRMHTVYVCTHRYCCALCSHCGLVLLYTLFALDNCADVRSVHTAQLY
eukprot:Lankesteria_metandrocarpae@DN3597_c0_g1_i1.p1